MPPRTKGDRLLIAFVCGVVVFGGGANLTWWVVPCGCVVVKDGTGALRSAQAEGPAWLLASHLLSDGDLGLLMVNLPQAAILLLLACVAGGIIYGRLGARHG